MPDADQIALLNEKRFRKAPCSGSAFAGPKKVADLNHEFLPNGATEVGKTVGRQDERSDAAHDVFAVPRLERGRLVAFEDGQSVDRHSVTDDLVAYGLDRDVGVAVVFADTSMTTRVALAGI